MLDTITRSALQLSTCHRANNNECKRESLDPRLGSHIAMLGSAASSSPTVADNDAFAASYEGSSALNEREAHVSLSLTATKNHLSPASELDALDPQSSAVMPEAAPNTFKDFTPNAACPRYMPRDG